jgi:2-succinyl-6-hydroxy-2,4-cyclohexadiene-1-carboxylate synthase
MSTESAYRFSSVTSGNRDNPAVLFLHGFMGCKEDWSDITEQLSDHFFTIAIDLPGHGGTTVRGPESLAGMENCSLGLIEYLARQKIDKFHVVGYSMGGRLALYLAVNYPGWCDRVTIESGSPGLKTESERNKRRAEDQARADQLESGIDMEQFLESWYCQPLFGDLAKSGEKYDRLLCRRKKNSPVGLARSLRNMGTGSQPSLWDNLASITFPILFLAGEKDMKYRALAVEMADLCPNGQYCIIDAVSHNTHSERPDRFIDEVGTFLGA